MIGSYSRSEPKSKNSLFQTNVTHDSKLVKEHVEIRWVHNEFDQTKYQLAHG